MTTDDGLAGGVVHKSQSPTIAGHWLGASSDKAYRVCLVDY